jgi:cytoskeletal protein CcmA (bactofilin family)
MAIFSSRPENERLIPTPMRTPEPQSQNDASALSMIAPGMRVVGDIETNGILKIEGRIEGTIRGARQLLLGKMGEIQGDVHAREVVVAGVVVGTIVADERTEIQGTSRIDGDIQTKTIVVHEGAVLNGTVRMGDQVAAPLAGASHDAGDDSSGQGMIRAI